MTKATTNPYLLTDLLGQKSAASALRLGAILLIYICPICWILLLQPFYSITRLLLAPNFMIAICWRAIITIMPLKTASLFGVPVEIRRLIYSFLLPIQAHVSYYKDRLRLSQCELSDASSEKDGFERQTTGDWSTDLTWARRLASKWGPHWQCEELAQSNSNNGNGSTTSDRVTAMASTCKQLWVSLFLPCSPT